MSNRLRPRAFRVARIGKGVCAHYVDDYRYQPARTICGKWLAEFDEVRTELDLPLCNVCSRAGDGYPTEVEFREYHTCTECGADTRTLGEYTVRNHVWATAFPLYAAGVGVGSTRPCIGCLEERLGRSLSGDDFILPPVRAGHCPAHDHPPTPDWKRHVTHLVPARMRRLLTRRSTSRRRRLDVLDDGMHHIGR